MSFLTAVLGYEGARNQARNQQQQTAYEDALQSRELGIEQQQANTQDAISKAQLAQYQQALEQAGRDRQFEAGLQLPKGWAGMQPDQRIAYLTNRYNAAQRAGDQDIAKSTLDEMNSLELGAERLANANYTTQGKLPLAQAQAQEAQARATYYRGKLGVDLQTAQMRLAAAQGVAASRVRVAQIAAAAALQRAGLSAQEQIEGRILAGYFALQGRNAADATQMAIADAKGANVYAEKSAMLTGQTSMPAYTTTQQELPNISLNVGTQGNDGAVLGLLAPIVRAIIDRSQGGRSGGNGVSPPSDTSGAQALIDNARSSMKNGASAAAIVQRLQHLVQSGQISASVQQQALRALFGHP